MPREHGEKGEFVETVTLDAVLDTFDEVRGPVVLSADVADRLGCTRETARRKLEALYDRGDLGRRKVARRVIYWRREEDAENGRERGHTAPEPMPAEHTLDDEDAVGAVLSGWEPATEADAETARAQTRRAVEYLCAEGGRHTKSDLVDALADGSTLGDRSWWERAVRPGLRRLVDEDLVEYRAGHHDYRWIGPTGA